MKNYRDHLPSGLLLAYAIYSAFIPVTIAHSIIIFALTVLCGLQIHISRQETTKFNKEILDSLKNELNQEITSIKEHYEKKLSKIEDEITKVQLNSIPSKVSSSNSQPRKMVF